MYVAISAGAILLLLVFLPDLFADDGKAKDEPAKADAPAGSNADGKPAEPNGESGESTEDKPQ